jgi:hypothetical protein
VDLIKILARSYRDYSVTYIEFSSNGWVVTAEYYIYSEDKTISISGAGQTIDEAFRNALDQDDLNENY